MMLTARIALINDMLRAKKISAVNLCASCLKRIEKTKELNQYISYHPQWSRQSATHAQRRIEAGDRGQLCGVPVAFKDNFSTSGVPTTCGSRMLHRYRPPYTATVVQRLLDHGAVPMGKTNLDEFAMGSGTIDSFFGPTKNPWTFEFNTDNGPTPGECIPDEGNIGCVMTEPFEDVPTAAEDWLVAGGSSGGSAVAVATGTVFGALGSDTGGSTRNPASMCGVVGLKPTYGRVSRHGLVPLVNSMDVPGVLARSVHDAAAILNVISGRDPLDSTTVNRSHEPVTLAQQANIKGLRVGIPKEYHAPGLSEDTKDLWHAIADQFDGGGASVSEVSLPHTQLSIVCYHILNACEVASNMARYDGIEYGHRANDNSSTESLYASSRHEALNDVVRSRILTGNYFLLRDNYDRYFMKALKVRRLIAEDFRRVFDSGIDLLLTPTVLGDAPSYTCFSKADNRTRTTEDDVFTQPVNMAGLPAIVVPSGLSSRGLPIGLQLIGQMFGEQKLMNAARWLEEQVDFPHLDLSHLDESGADEYI